MYKDIPLREEIFAEFNFVDERVKILIVRNFRGKKILRFRGMKLRN